MKKLKNWNGIINNDLASEVTTMKPYSYALKKNKKNKIKIVTIDFGCKKKYFEFA